LILHQNGRKHRNREAQIAEEEKQKTAALILEQKLIEEMKNPSIAKAPAKPCPNNVWGVSSTPPKFKLPPPPHPIVPHVTPSQKNLKMGPKSDTKTPTQTGSAFSPSISNFEQILNNSKNRTCTSGCTTRLVWDSSPGSARCVPLSLYVAPDLGVGRNRVNLSLGDFVSPSDQKTPRSSATAAAPWLSPAAQNSPSSKSLMEIQAEEANLKQRQDKSSGSSGGQWFVERRERASSLLEIQNGARQEEEERLLIEEQFKIEAQIMEENRKIQDEKAKSKPPGKRRPRNNQRREDRSKSITEVSSDKDSKPKVHPSRRRKNSKQQATAQ
jgi:hypothetical protein